jgi:hypothetical protein
MKRVVVVGKTDCTINLNLQGSATTPDDFQSYKNILYTVSYVDSTRTYSVNDYTPFVSSLQDEMTGL